VRLLQVEYQVKKAELALRNLTRRFQSGGGVEAVSLEIERGEFFVLLGPSGCGKSTLLRLIAGLEAADAGEIVIDGAGADRTAERDAVAMVFQNYALYPHMSAFENIAFPLRLRRVARDEIARRVAATAELAGLRIDLNRRPGELSGGERQRVALARALIREPRIVLLDEPLSNLDARLRGALRGELKAFQRRTGRTFIYVTHDQLEALTLADRLAVMRAGRVEQAGTPGEIYDRPASEFVAGFVGEPPMNLIRARIADRGDAIIVGESPLAITPPASASREVTLGVRPEDLRLQAAEGCVALEVLIESVEFSGARFFIKGVSAGARIVFESSTRLEAGELRAVYAPAVRLHFFDPGTGMRLERASA
jgi:ABC-type sugar transport system ATPase subunit